MGVNFKKIAIKDNYEGLGVPMPTVFLDKYSVRIQEKLTISEENIEAFEKEYKALIEKYKI